MRKRVLCHMQTTTARMRRLISSFVVHCLNSINSRFYSWNFKTSWLLWLRRPVCVLAGRRIPKTHFLVEWLVYKSHVKTVTQIRWVFDNDKIFDKTCIYAVGTHLESPRYSNEYPQHSLFLWKITPELSPYRCHWEWKWNRWSLHTYSKCI